MIPNPIVVPVTLSTSETTVPVQLAASGASVPVDTGHVVAPVQIDFTASAITLEPDEDATVDYSDKHFSFGIPKGEKGDQGDRGYPGADGEPGAPGEPGRDGTDGFSPVASVSKSGKTATITITDKYGTTTTTVKDGADGGQGVPGYSPLASVSKSGSTATIIITDQNGTTTASVSDGQDGTNGTNGTDGFSPIATVSKVGDTATISVTDANGTTTASVKDGANGTNGTNGQDGFSPVATVSKVGDTATISITDENGTTTASVSDGTDGTNGQDGYSPSASVTKAGGVVTISITDKDGTTSETVNDITTYAASPAAAGNATRSNGILYGHVDSTSTAKVFTATVAGVTSYYDGLTIMLYNGVITSASGFTIDINGLGAYGAYNNMTLGNDITPTAPTRDTTIFNVNYSMLFTFSTNIGNQGISGWICYRGYDANTNTIGYQLRTNSTIMTVTDTARYYKIYFTSANGNQWVPASANSTNNATGVRSVNQRPIDPFGRIVYTSANTNYTSGSNLAATTIWDQYVLTLGYSFNTTGAALTLTTKAPVYVKCAPQSDGSAIMDSTTPIVQALPSTEDGKIYIWLGIAISATTIELYPNHPVYYYKDSAIRIWTNAPAGGAVASVNGQTGTVVLDASDVGALPDSTVIPTVPTNVSSFNNDSGYLTSSTGVTSFNGSNGAITYTAPVTSVNGSTGAVTVTVPTKTSDLNNDSGFLTSAVTSFNGNTGAVTYTAPVTSVNGSTGAVSLSIPSITAITVELNSSNWSSNVQTVSAVGVTASNTVIVSASPSSIADYSSAGIYCSAQSANALEFTCSTEPTSTLYANVLIIS